MPTSIYLINPRSPSPSYFGAEVFARWGLAPAQGIADLAVATVAALAPPHWRVTVCDEHVGPVDLDSPADFIGITGKVTQGRRMIELAAEFRRRGKTVVIGGPFASLSPEVLRPHCDVLVQGELEGIAAELFADLERGGPRQAYVGSRPDLATSPLPRWDLYPNDRTLTGCVQTSRGCPFECEFCDVIQYLGRRQRHKPVEQILGELDLLYGLGYRAVFLADDNLTAYRRQAKEVLAGLARWNAERPDGAVAFSTQVSIDAARDPELVRLCAEAGMTFVFIGIETPNEASLRETHKRQNVGVDLLGQVGVFLAHGISVTAGMIVGFDHDGLDIFHRQAEFAAASPIPIFSLGALVAPAATPLHARMKAAGRLLEGGPEVAALPWDTNIVPALMSREELLAGMRWLCNRLYSPAAFARRVLQMIAALGPQRGPFRAGDGSAAGRRRPIDGEAVALLKKLVRSGPAERRMFAALERALAGKPEAGQLVLDALFRYAQVRCLYQAGEFWEPSLGELPDAPALAAAAAPPAA